MKAESEVKDGCLIPPSLQESCRKLFSLPSLSLWPAAQAEGQTTDRYVGFERLVSKSKQNYTDAKTKLDVESSYHKEVDMKRLTIAFHIATSGSGPTLSRDDLHLLGLPSNVTLPANGSAASIAKKFMLGKARGYSGSQLGQNCSEPVFYLLHTPLRAGESDLAELSKAASSVPDNILTSTITPKDNVLDMTADNAVMARPKRSFKDILGHEDVLSLSWVGALAKAREQQVRIPEPVEIEPERLGCFSQRTGLQLG